MRVGVGLTSKLMTEEIKKLYDPKTAFGNDKLIMAVKAAEAEKQRQREARQLPVINKSNDVFR